jgi:ABC-type multidrug transport system permease subunit
MMKSLLIATTAAIATALASPALAQAVISEPGYCAQFYPNANCQNYGPGNPYTDGGYWKNGWQNGYANGWQNGHASVDHSRYNHHRGHHE